MIKHNKCFITLTNKGNAVKRLFVVLDRFKLTLDGPMGQERLGINENHSNALLSQSIFSQLGLMHLIAPYLPNIVSTNFSVTKPIKKLIGGHVSIGRS